jgi:hypothetical protein
MDDFQARLDELNGEGLVVAADATPVDFLMAIFRSPQQPMSRRLRAAEAAAPYCHPKLAVTALVEGADFATALDRAVKRSDAARIKTIDAVKVPEIEPPKVPPKTDVWLRPTVADRRLRRL